MKLYMGYNFNCSRPLDGLLKVTDGKVTDGHMY